MNKLQERILEIKTGNVLSIESLLKELNLEASVLSKDKENKFLDEEVLLIDTCRTTFSGNWGVPNPTYTKTYVVNGLSGDALKVEIKELKKKEKEHRKNQKAMEKSYEDNDRRPESTSYTDYKVVTLRQVFKKFDKRQLDSRGTMSSVYHNYNIKNSN